MPRVPHCAVLAPSHPLSHRRPLYLIERFATSIAGMRPSASSTPLISELKPSASVRKALG